MKDSGKGVKVNVKDVKVRLKTLEMKYKNEMRERANAELRQKELEIENQKLKDELLLLKSRVAVCYTFHVFFIRIKYYIYYKILHLIAYFTVQITTTWSMHIDTQYYRIGSTVNSGLILLKYL